MLKSTISSGHEIVTIPFMGSCGYGCASYDPAFYSYANPWQSTIIDSRSAFYSQLAGYAVVYPIEEADRLGQRPAL